MCQTLFLRGLLVVYGGVFPLKLLVERVLCEVYTISQLREAKNRKRNKLNTLDQLLEHHCHPVNSGDI